MDCRGNNFAFSLVPPGLLALVDSCQIDLLFLMLFISKCRNIEWFLTSHLMQWENSNPRVSQTGLCPNLDIWYVCDFSEVALPFGASVLLFVK